MRPPAVWRRSPGIGPIYRVADRGNGWRHQSIQDGAAVCRLARPGAAAELHRWQETRLGRITKTGNREIRKLLVLGATSMVGRAVDGWNSATGAWLPHHSGAPSRQAGDGGTGQQDGAHRLGGDDAQGESTIRKGGAAVAAPATGVMLSRRMAGGGRKLA